MVETAPLWSVLVLPVVLGLLGVAAAGFDAVLTARASGRPGVSSLTALAVPLRDGTRLLVRQRRTTTLPDAVLWRLGGGSVFAAGLLAALVVPLGRYAVEDLSAGVVWFNAMEVLAWAGVWLAGWGPNSAYPLVAGYRFVAQGVAYELPHMFALITAAVGAQSLRVGAVADAQDGLWFVVWMPVAFAVFLVSAAAMAFWGPFSAPLGTELAGGVAAELSGVDRLVLLAGRWLLLATAAAMSVALFLGGGHGPLLPDWLWTLVKTAAVLAGLVWLRRRLPTLRMDRFEELAWMVLIPLMLAQTLAVAIVVVAR
jgi:NADH-quinone oxidoreductase subunit H